MTVKIEELQNNSIIGANEPKKIAFYRRDSCPKELPTSRLCMDQQEI